MLAGQQVQHAVESLALSVGDGQGRGLAPRRFFHAFQHIGEISAHPVHLVDEGDLGHAKALRLPPDRLGLRFHTGHAAEHAHRTVQHAQERSTSMVKSTWPGVSMRLMVCSFHWQVVQADMMVMPRSCSSGM